jgi:hypothetical protein
VLKGYASQRKRLLQLRAKGRKQAAKARAKDAIIGAFQSVLQLTEAEQIQSLSKIYFKQYASIGEKP